METQINLIKTLNAVKCPEKYFHNDLDYLEQCIELGVRNKEFRELVKWICHKIHNCKNTDEFIDENIDDPNEFLLELCAFIKELNCPYECCISGPITDRLQTKESKLLLLDFLLTELMAIRILYCKHQAEEKLLKSETETTLQPLSTSDSIVAITSNIGLGVIEDVAPKLLFEKISNKIDNLIETNSQILSKPLLQLPQSLTDSQWTNLEILQKQFDAEYNLRREMFLTRLDATIQSFLWSEKMKDLTEKIDSIYLSRRKSLELLKKGNKDTDIAALLAARVDIAVIEKISKTSNNSKKIQEYIMEKVPDRGGRAYEHALAMPSWRESRSTNSDFESKGQNRKYWRNQKKNKGGKSKKKNKT